MSSEREQVAVVRRHLGRRRGRRRSRCSAACSDDEWAQADRPARAGTSARSPHTSRTSSPSSPATRRSRSRSRRPPHIVSPMGAYTERGPIARAVVDDRRDHQRAGALLRPAACRAARRPTHGPAWRTDRGPRAASAGPGRRCCRTGPLDVWMHEQDIRRAVGRPGGLDSAAAAHTAGVFARGLGYVVGKRIAPPPGHHRRARRHRRRSSCTSPSRSVTTAAAARLDQEPPSRRSAWSPTSSRTSCCAAGDAAPTTSTVTVEGDAELGGGSLAALAVTP